MTDSYLEFCKNKYHEIYNTEFANSYGNEEEKSRNAQKKAILNAFIEAQINFPQIETANLWKAIYAIHVERKAGILVDPEIIPNIISADNSWKKSSGHAFEEMIKLATNSSLNGTNLEVLLQKDLTPLLSTGGIHNAQKDIDWLKVQTDASVFDLYMVLHRDGKRFVYGCIQSKTSVRDRVTRDREPSLQAMEHFFWSVAIVLDGQFMAMPKFIAMVNGGTDSYPKNGWHGMYVMSKKYKRDRIYAIDISFDTFIQHAKKAAEFWLTQRQWLNSDWNAEEL